MDKQSNPFLNPDWLAMQQQYMEALSSLNSAWGSSTRPAANAQKPFNDALEQWRKSIEAFVPADGRTLLDNILDQTRTFYSMAEDFSALLKNVSAADKAGEDWRSILATNLGRMKSRLDNQGSVGDHLYSQFHSCLFDSWKKAAGSMAAVPDEILAAFDDSPADVFARFAAMPGLGPSREFQQKLSEAGLLWKVYQERLNEYRSILAQLGKLALDRLEQKIYTLANSEGRITSLRQLYNLWVDANEEVFAEFAFNEDHSRFYGELVNALLNYRNKLNRIIDDVLELMNLPNASAMQTVYKRQHDMRRTLQDLQQQLQEYFSAARSAPASAAPAGRSKNHTRKKNTGTKKGSEG